MKKTKFIALIALTLCFVMVLASCGAAGELKYYNSDFDDTKTLTTATKLDSLATAGNYMARSESGKLMWFYTDTDGESKDGIKATVYNFDTNTVVAAYTAAKTAKTNYSVAFGAVSGVEYYILKTTVTGDSDTTVSWKLFDATGKQIAEIADVETEDEAEAYVSMLDDFKFGAKVYTTDKKGAIVELGTASEFVKYEGAKCSKDYIYTITSDGISVTDKLGNFVSSYTYKTGYEGKGYEIILANGNVAIQYIKYLAMDAKNYDIVYDDEMLKVDYVTEIYNVKTGAVKEVKVDYVINGEVFNGTMTAVDSDYEDDFDYNVIKVKKFVDKKLGEEVVVVVNNNLKIKASNNDIVEGCTSIKLIGDDRYIAEDKFGNAHFIFENKVIKTVPKSSYKGYNEKYIYTDKAIYDLDFKSVYDLKANKATVENAGNTSILLKKDIGDGKYNYVLYTNAGTEVTLATDGKTASGVLGDRLFLVNADNKYTYYNEAGASIGTYEKTIVSMAACDNGNVLVKIGDDFYSIA